MTSMQKRIIISAIENQIDNMNRFRYDLYAEKNYEIGDIFDGIVDDLKDALRAFESEVK